MTREEAWNRIDAIIAKHEIDDEYVTITSFLDYDALRMARKVLEQEPNIVALGEELRICQNSITDEKVLIGFNMAVALCNKHLGESEG